MIFIESYFTAPIARSSRNCLLVVALGLQCACASPEVKNPRAPPTVAAAQVQIYLQPPEAPYRHIAEVSASSKGSLRFSDAAKIDAVIDRLKQQAARLGANGLLLHGVGNQSAGSVGAGISTETNTVHTANDLAFGASTFLSRKVGDAEAIYVESAAPTEAP